MKGYLAGLSAAALVASTFVAVSPQGAPVALAATATGDPVAVGLAAGLGRVADWYADELPDHDRFGEVLPLVDLTPGADVGLRRVFGDLLPFRSSADLGDLADVQDLADVLTTSGQDPLDDSLSFAVDATPVGSSGLEVTVTIERDVDDVGFAIVRDADGTTPVNIASPPGEGVSAALSFTSTLTVHFTPAQDQFWIDANPAPSMVVAAAIDPDPYTVAAPGLPANVGILDVTVQPGSTLGLDVALTATLIDTDGDGILQFDEMPDDGSTNTVPGEMRFALEDLVAVTRSGSVAGDLHLDPATVVMAGGPGTAQVTVVGADLSAGDPEIVTDAAYDDVFADFLNISATDLLGGVGQLFMASSLVQGHPEADIQLPLLGLNLRQAVNPAAGLADFVVANSNTEGGGFDPENPEGSDFGSATFDTIGEMVARMTDATDGVAGIDLDLLVPTYDPATQLLDLRISIDNSLGSETPVEDQDGNSIGWLDFGDLLQDGAGIRGLKQPRTTAAGLPFPSEARIRQGGGIDYHWTVDLQPGVPCDDPETPEDECDDPENPTFEITEHPPVFERFGLRSGEGPEITVLSSLRVPVAGSQGSAGWVTVRGASGNLVYQPGAGASEPTLTVDLLLADGHQSIHSFLKSLTSEGSVAGKLGITRDLDVVGTLGITVADGDGNPVPVLGSLDPAELSFNWPGAHAPGSTPTVATTDARSTLLKALDYDPAHRTALFGKVVDTIDGLVAQVEQVGSNPATQLITSPVPMLGRSLKSLFREAASLSSTIDALRTAGPPGSLQDFEKAVQNGLGGVLGGTAAQRAGWLTFQIDDVGDNGTPDVVFSLSPSSSHAEDIPLTLPLSGFGDLFGGVEGTLGVQVAAGLDLGFPVEVSASGVPAPNALQVRQSSGFDVDATAALGQGQSVAVKIGGVKLQLGPGGEAKAGAGVEVAVGGATDDFVTAGSWLGGLQAELQTDTQTCTTTTVPADHAKRTQTGAVACVNAPAFINGSPINSDAALNLLRVSANDLTSDPSVELPTGLADALAAQVLDLLGLGDLLPQLNALLARVLDAAEWGSKLPLIGKHLAGDAQAITKVQDALQAMASALDNPTGAVEEEGPKVGDVRAALASAAEQLPTDLLVEVPGEDTVRITLTCEFACDDDAPATTVQGVEVEFSLGQDGNADAFVTPFDLGLPGLPLRVDGGVSVNGAWSVDLGLGISRQHGAYLLSNPRSSRPDGSADPPEIVASAAANLDGSAQATLGVFRLGITVDSDDNGVSSDFTANLPNMGGGRITAAQLLQVLGNPGQLSPTFDISSGVRLVLEAAGALPGVHGLPGLEAELCYRYPVAPNDDCDGASASATGPFDPTAALIQFDGIKLNLGQALEDLLGEPLRFVGDITEPIEPVLSFLTTPIPVISDLSRMFGGSNVTMLSLAKLLGMDDSAGFIESIAAVLGLANQFATAGTITLADTVVLDAARAATNRPAPDQAFDALVESLSGPVDPGDPAVAAQKDKVSASPSSAVSAPILDDPACLLRMAFGADCDIVRWEPPPLRVEFTYEQAFGPFFGVLYVTIGGFAGAQARLGLGLSTAGVREALDAKSVVDGIAFALNGLYIIDYPGPEISLDAGLKAGGKIDAVIAAAGVEGGVAAELGFDLRDPVPDGRVHVSEVKQKILTPLCLFDIVGRLKAFLDVWARLGVGPFSVRKTFRLAEVTLLDFSAAISSTCDDNSPPVLAETIGDNEAAQSWDFGARGTHTLQVLRLNMGESFAGARGAFKTVVNENFAVRELVAPVWDGNTPVSPGRYEVSAFGFVQEAHPKEPARIYQGYAVVFQAGTGNDTLVFTGGQSVDLTDPDLDLDKLPTMAFTSPVWGDLGPGNDVIYTGEGDDRIAGGPGEDRIFLGGGNDRAHGDSSAGLNGLFSTSDANDQAGSRDIIDGGDGDDRLWGGGGNDEINGGNGNDRLFGGDGNDVLYGDDGNDRIVGGRGTDTIYGGGGNDVIFGDFESDGDDPNATGTVPAGSARDVIYGGPGNDTIYGGGGNDEIFGAEGNDTIFGQWGNDRIEGNEGNDLLAGGPGSDTIDGGDGNDRIWGDARPEPNSASSLAPDDSLFGGNDTLRGGAGSDFIDGGGGNDTIFGGPGNDAIVGGWGQDTIRGEAGNDLIAGDVTEVSGSANNWSMTVDPDDGFPVGPCFDLFGTCFVVPAADTIFGGDGNDTIHGQSGGDRIHAGLGNDLVFGNAGNDEIWGDGGNDELHGNVGDDRLMGGPGDDLIHGGPGSDELYGHAGNDRLIGGSADPDAPDDDDILYGGAGHDVLLGDNGTVGDPGVNGETVFDESKILPVNDQTDAGTFGDDHLHGGSGRDVLHGQDGDDRLFGGPDEDQLFGELGEDWLEGGPGHDTLLGDRGTVTPAAAVDPDGPSGTGRWPGGAPKWTVQLVEPNTGGVDHLFGQSGDDRMFGGWENDHMEGGPGDDHMEGNGGRDTMYGNAPESGSLAGPMSAAEALLAALDPSDADDMIGGSSDVNPEEAKLDDGEFLMFGNEGEDVMAGDNANIVGVVDPEDPTTWAIDDVTGGRLRHIELLDREKSEDTPIMLSEVSGGDLMHGNEGNDRMYGQGGTDILRGNDGDDFIQGNQDRDLIEGGPGDDDLIGGSEFLSPFAGIDGRPADLGDFDDGDEIYGGAGNDVILGDNGIITRVCEEGVAYNYVTTQLGIGAQRCIILLDLDELSPGHFGRDVLSGGAGVDVLFGQDDDDIVAGGPDDDYMEGNGGDDWLFGDSLASEVKVDPPTITLPYEQLPPDVQDDLALPTPGTLEFPPPVPFFDTCPLEDDTDNNDCRSPKLELEGPDGLDGQDDQIGGSSQPDFRDGDDVIFGDGGADFQLGDNGVLNRTIVDGAYLTYVDYNPTTVVREAIRYDVNGPPHTHGDDVLIGGDGDDYQYGQDGNDALLGQNDNDEQYGELGDDWIDGGRGQDVQIGDRGSVVSRLLGPGEEVTHTTGGPAFFDILFMREGTLDRRVDLLNDVDGTPLEFPGLTHGGNDIMLGGPGHDVMHGGFGDDVMNGNGGGDWMYGGDGADVMWGGRGCVPDDPEDGFNDDGSTCSGTDDPGLHNQFVDIMFGGHSGDTPDTADILDFRPRPDIDPLLWHLLTGTLNDDVGDPTTIADNDHNHGVDWIYGGWGRDVLQGNIGQNGPEPDGDRLIDWVGNYNLYTRCNASYGDDGDIRQRSPQMETLLELLAFATGVGNSVDDVRDPTTSAYRELALVYKPDTKDNNGKAFPNSPGHFNEPSCLP